MENIEYNIEPREEKPWNNSLVNFINKWHLREENPPGSAEDEDDICENLTATYWG